MRLFKPEFKDSAGRSKQVKKWSVEFRDHTGRVRRVAAFTDKRQSESLGGTLERLVTYRTTGAPLDLTTKAWVDTLTPRLRARLLDIGLLDGRQAAAGLSLLDHLDGEKDASGRVTRPGFRQFLLAKGNTPKHADNSVERVRRILTDCAVVTWPQMTGAVVLDYLHRRRKACEGKAGISAASYNHYLRAVKAFGRWMVKDGRASESPVAYLETVNVKADPRHARRALTAEEATWLLSSTAKEEYRWCMTGPERSMLYRLVIETGLRANEVGTLTGRRCELDGDDPSIVVVAGYAKARRERRIPLKRATAAALTAFVAGKMPDAAVFHLPRGGSKGGKVNYKTAEMLRDDIEAARAAWLAEVKDEAVRAKCEKSDFLRYKNAAGEHVDFHALRHTRGVWLFEHHRAHPREVMELLGVGSLALVERYTRSFRIADNDVVERGPSLPDPMANKGDETQRRNLA